MTAARRSQRKNRSSRTLVLMATMRSSANDSQDQTISRAHLRQEHSTSASDRPRFSRIHGVPTGAPQLFRDSVQFCSGLVDLVVGVGSHGGDCHRFALAGERFVVLVAEDIAEVGDRRVDLGNPCCGKGIERETGDGGRRFVALEPVEKGGENCQRVKDRGGVARVVEVADRQRSSSRTRPADRRVGLQVQPYSARQVGFVEAVAAVLSDH